MGDDITLPCKRSILEEQRHLELKPQEKSHFPIWQTLSRSHLDLPLMTSSGGRDKASLTLGSVYTFFMEVEFLDLPTSNQEPDSIVLVRTF